MSSMCDLPKTRSNHTGKKSRVLAVVTTVVVDTLNPL